ncbi:MAG: peptidase E [Actinomycetota bacterium]|nr:MAG: peptidase E [Actinomycetota bacterium]
MPVRRILATSGGLLPTDRWGVARPGDLLLEALRLTGADRPRVCLLATATGDDAPSLLRAYHALGSLSCDVTHLALFPQPNADIAERLGSADLVWVGGGSVANLLAVWRCHGVDGHLTAAWEAGTVLAGVSAGSICWHVGGPTDSFGPVLQPVSNGLALLPYGNGVHYDSEPQRRPLLARLVATGALPTSYATDDRIGILYEGTEAVRVLADLDVDPVSGPAAYRVERVGPGDSIETRLPVGRIGSPAAT